MKPRALEILNCFCDFVQKNKFMPTRGDMLLMGFNRDSIRNYFGSMTILTQYAEKHRPKVFNKLKSKNKPSGLSKQTSLVYEILGVK